MAYYNVAGCDHHMVETTRVGDSVKTFECVRCGYTERSSRFNGVNVEVKDERVQDRR